jgi:hypothetical protein
MVIHQNLKLVERVNIRLTMCELATRNNLLHAPQSPISILLENLALCTQLVLSKYFMKKQVDKEEDGVN